jgi:hypothetical protein
VATPLFAGDFPPPVDSGASAGSRMSVIAENQEAAHKIIMIDARALSIADLMALAARERAAPIGLSCCDWGGGCEPHAPGA